MASALPWRVFTSPAEKWAVQPTFVVGEYLFMLCAAIALYHAASQPAAERTRHLVVWFGALVAGTANDIIFMALPLVDNFWQAQATVMLSPRMPLYIPCVYVWFMYAPTVAVWRLGLPLRAAAPLSGLLAILIYAPYDILGAKFLWWTWHDTDGPIANRLLGAPIGSTMWVITFVATFAALLGYALRHEDRDAPVERRTVAKALALVAGLTTVVMMLQLTVLQQLDGGVPGIIGLCTIVAIDAALIAWGWRERQARPPPQSEPAPAADRRLFATVAVYFITLAGLMAAFHPESHRSLGVHQTVGECYVEATDITGATRFAYLCVDDFDEDFTFDCVDARANNGTRWYPICGRPHSSYASWLAAMLVLGALGTAGFAGSLVRRS
jgi:hypothetical protein